MPRVSVIIPLYNCERYIADAVRSVLAQPISDIETIVVDDGSTDGSVAALAPFGDAIRVIRQANAGVAAARNTGLDAARGELIAFLDADDWWLPSRLPAQLAALERFPQAGLVFADFLVADLHGDMRLPRGIRWKYRMVKDESRTPWPAVFAESATIRFDAGAGESTATAYAGSLARWLFMGNFINTCSVLVPRAAIDRTGGFDATLSTEEDYDYWLRLAGDWPMIYVDAPLLAFRQRPGQLTRGGQIETILRNVARVTNRARRRLGPMIPHADVASRLAHVHRDLAEVLLRRGGKAEARRALVRSVRHRPLRASTWAMLGLALLPGDGYGRLERVSKWRRAGE